MFKRYDVDENHMLIDSNFPDEDYEDDLDFDDLYDEDDFNERIDYDEDEE